MRILDSKEEEDQPIVAEAPVITDYLNDESRKHYELVKYHLDNLSIVYEETPRLVRGLDYYTKTAFELTSPDLGAQDALGGGGRYDLLIEEIGGPATPAVGFASGMERLMIACEALGIDPAGAQSLDVYIVTRGDTARAWALQHAPKLREAGQSVAIDYNGRSLKAQMKEANREGASYAIIVGDSELESGELTFRVMASSTEEKTDF
jgi:histidyl-tRNA synthetase